MAFDDILFHRRQVVALHGIFQRHRRVMEAMKPFVGLAVMPVIQKKIMQKCPTYQFGIRRAQMKAAVQIKTEPGYAEHMVIGRDMPMLDKMFHELRLLRLVQPMKKGSDFRSFF